MRQSKLVYLFHSYAEGVGRFATSSDDLPVRTAIGPYRGKVIHTGWSRFIRRMILSDVNIYRYTGRGQPDVEVVDIYVGSRHEYEDAYHIRTTHDLTAATASST